MCRLSLNEKRILVHHYFTFISEWTEQVQHMSNFTSSFQMYMFKWHSWSIICVITWYVAPAGVVELAAEVLAEPWQIWLPVWHRIHVRGVEQHLGIGGAASTFDLLQEMSAFCVVGGENLETTRNKANDLLKWWVNFYLFIPIAQANQQTWISLVFGNF